MKTFITSDLHFFHGNIIKYCPETRGRFKDATEMNEYMIHEWNNTVAPDDQVFILGDFAFCKPEPAVKLLDRLNGGKILIEGNHDVKLAKDSQFRSRFIGIHKYYKYRHGRHTVIMFHYPILEWENCHHGSVHFHGHVHGKKTGREHLRIRDVGFDATGNVVTDFETILADALTGEIGEHH